MRSGYESRRGTCFGSDYDYNGRTFDYCGTRDNCRAENHNRRKNYDNGSNYDSSGHNDCGNDHERRGNTEISV